MYINPSKNKAFCFRCKFSSKNAEALVEQYNIELPDFTTFGTIEPSDSQPILRLPDEYSTFFQKSERGQQALAYLLSRGISPVTVATYQLGFCEGGRYDGRVLIPFFEDGELANFQARDYLGGMCGARYLGPSQKDGAKSNVLFNLDRMTNSPVMVLVEGPLDALRLPEYAVALQGSSWNSIKLSKIIRANPAHVLLALDQDQAGFEAQEKIYNELNGIIGVQRLALPGKDLGGLPEPHVQRIRQLCDKIAKLEKSRSREVGESASNEVR